jgi:hypothetical protein
VAIAAGDQFSLALCADGSLYAWGSNDRGQLGYPAITSQSSVAVRVLAQRGDPPEAKAIAASAAHGMALTADARCRPGAGTSLAKSAMARRPTERGLYRYDAGQKFSWMASRQSQPAEQ